MAGGLPEEDEGQSERRPGQFWCLFVPEGFKPRISLEKQVPEEEAEKDIFIDPNEVLRDILGPDKLNDNPKDIDEKKVLATLEQDPVQVKCEPEVDVKQDDAYESSIPTSEGENSQRNSSKKELFKCITCSYETKLFADLKSHLTMIHQIRMASEAFRCEKCDKKTESWRSMKDHLFNHVGWKEIIVFNCSFKARLKSNLRHKKTPKPRGCKIYIKPVDNNDISNHPDNDDEPFKETTEPIENDFYGDNSFTCQLCPFDTSHALAYKEHLRSHQEFKTIKCDLCFFEAEDDSCMKTHLDISHATSRDPSKLKCNFCKFKTRKKLVLRKHMYEAHHIATKMIDKKKQVTDLKPSKSPSSKLNRKRGENKEKSDWFSCDKCEFKTRFKCSLKTHMIKHKPADEIEKKFMCEECSACFRTRAYLASHMLKHKSLDECQTYQCEYCEYRTKFKYNLTKHALKHKDPSECPMFQCEICGFKCKRKYNFKNHQLTHKSEEEVPVYKCAICAYQTKCKDYLAAHLKKGTHLGQRKRGKIRKFTDTKCNVCGIEMKDPGNLYRHTLTHKNIDQVDENMIFRCDQCDYKSLFKGRLVMHEKIHKRMEEVETFPCPHCDYKSKMKGNLKQHINKVHVHPSERKTFQCHVCSIQLKSTSNLKTHLMTHKNCFEAEMIKCQICSYETKFKSYMRMHLKKKHNILAPSAKRRGISYTNQSTDKRNSPLPSYF